MTPSGKGDELLKSIAAGRRCASAAILGSLLQRSANVQLSCRWLASCASRGSCSRGPSTRVLCRSVRCGRVRGCLDWGRREAGLCARSRSRTGRSTGSCRVAERRVSCEVALQSGRVRGRREANVRRTCSALAPLVRSRSTLVLEAEWRAKPLLRGLLRCDDKPRTVPRAVVDATYRCPARGSWKPLKVARFLEGDAREGRRRGFQGGLRSSSAQKKPGMPTGVYSR